MQEKPLKNIHGIRLKSDILKNAKIYKLGWLVGIFEGEGSFSIRIQKIKANYQCITIFQVCQVEKKGIIDEIGKILSNYGIKYRITYIESRGLKIVQVTRKDDCLKICEILGQSMLYGKKKKAFKYWNQAVILINNKEHLTENGFKKLLFLRDKLWRYSCRRNPYKISPSKDRIGKQSTLWTNDEIHILLENYSLLKIHEFLPILPNRTVGAIKEKAFSLGIHRIKNREKIPLDVNELKKEYEGGSTISEIATKKNVSPNTIWMRLRNAGVPMRLPLKRRN